MDAAMFLFLQLKVRLNELSNITKLSSINHSLKHVQ